MPAAVLLAFLLTAPQFLGTAVIGLLSKILIFSLIGMSLDIVFGYAGMWSFGHAALAGVGSYTAAILIEKAGISSFWIIAPASLIVAGIISALIGAISLRTSGIYFLLITFALGQLVYSIVFKWRPLTGGFDGLGGIPYPDLGFFEVNGPIFYYFMLFFIILCAFLIYSILKSPFGYALQGIREDETRMQALGYNTWLYKLIAFIVSGLFAGVGGLLYVYYNGLIAPANIGMDASGLIMIMIIIGGGGTLWGAIFGSAIIFLVQYYVSIFIPERWPIVLGVCFIAAVFLARAGVFPRLNEAWKRLIKT
jgi:branched-chain amino acid transport system permease protein